MDEAEAKRLLDVPRETIERLEAYVDLLAAENERQNLVSRSSLGQVWARHILDSAQLGAHSPSRADAWLDLGSGAGFPGLVLALLRGGRFTLVESRRLRAEFLHRAAATLGIGDRVEVVCARLESLPARPFEAISARAFAPLDRIFALAGRFSTPGTTWLLPRGRNAQSELEAARASWQGDIRLEPSVTDPDSGIVVATAVRPRLKGRAKGMSAR